MKTVLSPSLGTIRRVRETQPCPSAPDVEERLLSEIRRLGGEDRENGARGALNTFHSALRELVRENPKAYGAEEDATSQDRMVLHLMESVRGSFLARTVENLRHKSGYVLFFGCWIHRAAFTFVGFGVLAAAVLPFCAISLMSTSAWGWMPGAFGFGAAILLGGWILSRIRQS